MKPAYPSLQCQRGISLIMSLIMLVVLTMIAISATYSTNSSIRVVGNMQLQDESLTAAQIAIDDQIGKLDNFTAPADRIINVDVNRDGTNDYKATLPSPVCIGSKPKSGYSASMADSGSAPITTTWDARVDVENTTTGSRVTLHQGVRIDMLPYQGCT